MPRQVVEWPLRGIHPGLGTHLLVIVTTTTLKLVPDTASPPTYAVYALRYGRHGERYQFQNLVRTTDPHELMPLDFFVWAIVGDDLTVVVDTGFDHDLAAERGMSLLRTPAEALAQIDVDAATTTDVILTHLHYDHAGTTGDFPLARFHLQDTEMAYATSRHMTEPYLGHAYHVSHVVEAVRNLYGGRVVFHDGDQTVAPGISVHLVGGHTRGLQVVRVHTEHGWLVLASDATHFYENLETRVPFPIVDDVQAMLAGYDRLLELADTPAQVIPGHDPEVLERFESVAPDVVRVDRPIENDAARPIGGQS